MDKFWMVIFIKMDKVRVLTGCPVPLLDECSLWIRDASNHCMNNRSGNIETRSRTRISRWPGGCCTTLGERVNSRNFGVCFSWFFSLTYWTMRVNWDFSFEVDFHDSSLNNLCFFMPMILYCISHLVIYIKFIPTLKCTSTRLYPLLLTKCIGTAFNSWAYCI